MANPWDFSGTINAAYDARERQQQNESIQQLRDMQIQEYRQKLKEQQALEEVRRGGTNYLAQNQHLLNPTTINTTVPNYNQSLGLYQPPSANLPMVQGGDNAQMPLPVDYGGNSYEVPAEQTISKTLPAKETELSLLGKYYTKSGYPEKGIPMQKEGRLDIADQIKGMTSLGEEARKLVAGGNEKAAQALIDAGKMAYTLFKDTEFSFDKKTGYSTIQMPMPNGQGWVTMVADASGNPLGKPHYSLNKETNPSLYGDFSRGYKSELRKKYPGMDEDQISLSTATEAEKRKLGNRIQGIEAGADIRSRYAATKPLTEAKMPLTEAKMPQAEKKVFDSLISRISKREDNPLNSSTKGRAETAALKQQANTIAAPYNVIPFPEIKTQTPIKEVPSYSRTIKTPHGEAIAVPGAFSKSGKQVYKLKDGRLWEQ